MTVRLLLAALCGGLLGFERGRAGKEAGLRTHMLVTLGVAFFVLIPQQAGVSPGDMNRVIQGIITGIGFIGAGTILKLSEREEVRGLTTAAGIWFCGRGNCRRHGARSVRLVRYYSGAGGSVAVTTDRTEDECCSEG